VTVQSEHRTSEVNRPLVIGFGNVLLGDDGAGVELVDRLRTQSMPGRCEYLDGGTLSFTLLPFVECAAALLVVDAAELDLPPGSVTLFEGAAMDEFLRSARRRTVHEVGLTDLLDMARLRDCLPERRALLCIQPSMIDWATTLSPAVDGGLGAGVRLANALLDRWSPR
jgi:hydrogenase maturation protease